MDEKNYAVDIEACRGRQRRLLAEMEREALDWVVLTTHEAVQWLTGAIDLYSELPPELQSAALGFGCRQLQ